MIIAGYLAAILICISLGLIGGGGSILTIPVLVYLFNIQPTIATGYSLFIVGATSFAGAKKNYRNGLVNLKIALYFSCTSLIVVLVTRKFLLEIIPENLFTTGNFVFTKSLGIMLLFALIMVAAALKMIFDTNISILPPPQELKALKIILSGVVIGLLTGLLGAGGGFLIIPALIFLFHLPVKEAIGTSLLIISINNLLGFTADIYHTSINWHLLLGITAIAIAGIFAGTSLNKKISGDKLKKGFGWFVLIMAVYVFIRELSAL